MEFHLFLPQLRLSFDRLVASARAAEAAGFGGPLGRIPAVIGGAGPRTRVSVLQMVAYVPDGASRAAITETATRRFGAMKPVIGTGPELVDHFGRLGGDRPARC